MVDLEERLKKEYKKKKAWGLSTSYDLHGCNPYTIRDPGAIKNFVVSLCNKLGIKRHGPCRLDDFGENEDVTGYSMTQYIETSLISAHFVNKTNKVFLDVFSCAFYNPKTIADYAKEFFEAKSIKYKYILRI